MNTARKIQALSKRRISLRKPWIRIIILLATIHGFRAQSMDHVYLKGAKYIQIRGLSMNCAAQTTDRLVRSQVQSKDKVQVSGVALAGLYKPRARIAQSHSNGSRQHFDCTPVTTLLPFIFRSTKFAELTLRICLCPWQHLHVLWRSVQEGASLA